MPTNFTPIRDALSRAELADTNELLHALEAIRDNTGSDEARASLDFTAEGLASLGENRGLVIAFLATWGAINAIERKLGI